MNIFRDPAGQNFVQHQMGTNLVGRKAGFKSFPDILRDGVLGIAMLAGGPASWRASGTQFLLNSCGEDTGKIGTVAADCKLLHSAKNRSRNGLPALVFGNPGSSLANMERAGEVNLVHSARGTELTNGLGQTFFAAIHFLLALLLVTSG